MEIRHLHYFMVVYQTLHFSKAAEQIGISQPTLSQQIQVLEVEVGTNLFDRVGKKIYPTQAGDLLYQTGSRIFAEMDEFGRNLKKLQGNSTGILRIGFSCNESIRRVLIRYNRLHPQIMIQATEKSTKETIEDIKQNKKEIGVVRSSYHQPELTSIPLYTEHFSVVATKSLLKDLPIGKESLSLRDIARLPLALYPTRFLIREMIDQEARKQGMTLEPKFEFSTMDSLIDFAENGMAATILPDSFVQEIDSDHFLSLPITGEELSQLVQIIFLKGRHLSKAAESFVDLLKDYHSREKKVSVE
ncbi:MAG: LysR family transcriptional regulator [Sporolactobacillus sp.]